MKKLNKLLLVLTLISPSAYAVDLLEAWQAAKQNDVEFSAEQHRKMAGLEKRYQSHSLLLPQLNLSTSFANLHTDVEYGKQGEKDYAADGNRYGYVLSAAYPLYDASNLANAQQLLKQSKMSRVKFRQSEQELILRVSRAYFDYAIAQERLQSVLSQKESLQEQVNMTQKSYDLGMVSINDFYEARASFDRILSDEIIARSDMAVAHNALEKMVGLKIVELKTIHQQLEPIRIADHRLPELKDLAKNNNQQILLNRYNLEIVEQEVVKFRIQGTPTLELYASYAQSWNDGGLSSYGGRDFQQDSSIGLQFTLPLYTGGNRSSRLRESISEVHQQKDLLALSIRNSEQQTFAAFQDINASVANYYALQQRVKSAEKLLDASKVSRRAGLRTTADVLRADQNFHQAKFELVSAGYDYLYKKLRLAQVTGGLNEVDLTEVNLLLKERS